MPTREPKVYIDTDEPGPVRRAVDRFLLKGGGSITFVPSKAGITYLDKYKKNRVEADEGKQKCD